MACAKVYSRLRGAVKAWGLSVSAANPVLTQFLRRNNMPKRHREKCTRMRKGLSETKRCKVRRQKVGNCVCRMGWITSWQLGKMTPSRICPEDMPGNR